MAVMGQNTEWGWSMGLGSHLPLHQDPSPLPTP